MEEVIGTLTTEQYINWRVAVFEMKIAELEHKLLIKLGMEAEKDIEISKLKLELFRRTQVTNQANKYDKAKSEFNQIITDIELVIREPLKNCAINDQTLEVSRLPS